MLSIRFCFLLSFALSFLHGETPLLMPVPAHTTAGSGRLLIDQNFHVKLSGYSEPRLERAVQRMLGRLGLQFGSSILGSGSGALTLTITCKGAGKEVQAFDEDESYSLNVVSTGATLSAPQPLGVIRGIETFLQLVQPGEHGLGIDQIQISDQPRFPWRGLLLDSSRHFMPVDEVKRTLDGMAVVKLNVLHWHLSDNQGFRVESRVYPRLQEVGSGGLFYTQQQIRDIIDYARDRGIRILPEFDMPGHCTGMLVAYPEIATEPAPRDIDHVYGVLDPVMDPSKPEVYEFLDRFITEMAALFPDAYFHIGGDEVNGNMWRASPRVREFKQEHGIQSTPTDPDGNIAFHAVFNKRLQAIVEKHGKHMVGWEEILNPSLPQGTVIQSWRGQKSLADAAHQGYAAILSSGWYLDLAHSAADHYLVDAIENESGQLSSDEQKRILGGEAAMWSEWITAETTDSRIWPRAAVVAERLWSPQQTRDVNDMYRRLSVVSAQLEYIGSTHLSWQSRMFDRLVGSADTEPLRIFASMVEPVKDYERESFGSATISSPLVGLVDSVPPENDQVRRWNRSISEAISQHGSWDPVRALLTLWKQNAPVVAPLLARNPALAGTSVLNTNGAVLAEIGLDALDRIHSHSAGNAQWKAESLTRINKLNSHAAALQLSIVDGVSKLVNAIN